MHIVVFFKHIGHYHIARLRATFMACQQINWQFTAIQVTDQTCQHPWGDLEHEMTFPVRTLLPAATTSATIDRHPDSPIAAKLLPELLDTVQPDVLAIPGWGFSVSRAALAWSQQHQIPTILMSESKWDDEPRTWWKEQLKSQLYVRKYDTAIVGSKQHRDYLMKLGMHADRIFFGYDVVDNDFFAQKAEFARRNPQAARQRQPKIPHKPYFLAVTRLLPRKNIVRLVEAYAAYHQQIGEQAWDLVVCGNGEEELFIRQLIQNYQLEVSVHLPGFVTYNQVSDWYGLAEAFIHPALQEQWGLVVNEACAAGLPILCSRTVGACYELVHEMQNGLTFDPTSTEDMTQTLFKLHSLTPTQRTQMGQCSQQIVAQYSPQHFADGLMQAVDRMLSLNQRSEIVL